MTLSCEDSLFVEIFESAGATFVIQRTVQDPLEESFCDNWNGKGGIYLSHLICLENIHSDTILPLHLITHMGI